MQDNDTQQPNLTADETMNLFIEGIMDEKGVDAPTPEIRQQIFDDLKSRLLTEIDRSLVGELPDAKLDKLTEMANANGGQLDPNAVAQAISDAGIDVTEVTGITMQRFRELYLNGEGEAAGAETAQEVSE